jgi:hypothetical protein
LGVSFISMSYLTFASCSFQSPLGLKALHLVIDRAARLLAEQ